MYIGARRRRCGSDELAFYGVELFLDDDEPFIFMSVAFSRQGKG